MLCVCVEGGVGGGKCYSNILHRLTMSGVSESSSGSTVYTSAVGTGSTVRSSPIWSVPPPSSDAMRHTDTPPIGQVCMYAVCEV